MSLALNNWALVYNLLCYIFVDLMFTNVHKTYSPYLKKVSFIFQWKYLSHYCPKSLNKQKDYLKCIFKDLMVNICVKSHITAKIKLF